MSRIRILSAVALAAAVLAGSTQTALAGQPAVNVKALGNATTNASGGIDYSGYLYGPPFSGNFTGTLTADDGTLPSLGKCEPGTATLRVEADHGPRYFELVGTGQICGEWTPWGTMQRLMGRWTMASTNFRPLADTEGHMDFRMLNSQADIYAAES
jgi:hypothetical protein